jgi:ribosomal protein S18 acetylase RimI-like enzyme
VGVAEVSLPGGQRFGAEKLEPKAPGDFPYISDVAVAPNQGKRGIGRALVRACEAAVAAQVSLFISVLAISMTDVFFFFFDHRA